MKKARIAVPDFVSNSYFPAIAAVALDEFAKHGLEVHHELIFPNYRAYEALRDGEIDFVAGPAHAALKAFPDWKGAKLLCALAQGMYWLLVMRADLVESPGDMNITKGRSIGAAPLVDLGLRRMIIDAGLDLVRDDIRIVEVPGGHEPGVSFGVAAAKALETGALDGFWANAMGAEVAIQKGVGKVAIDVRRALGPSRAVNYTFAALVTSDRTIQLDADLVRRGLGAVIDAQRKLKIDATLAREVGIRLFPPLEAGLIGNVIERDVTFYNPTISTDAVEGLIQFTKASDLLRTTPRYEEIVAMEFADLWNGNWRDA